MSNILIFYLLILLNNGIFKMKKHMIEEKIIQGHIISCREDISRIEKEMEEAKKTGVIILEAQKNNSSPTIK